MSSLVCALLDLLAPRRCAVCARDLSAHRLPHLCDACLATFQPVPAPFCVLCGEPFVALPAANRCVTCLHSPPPYAAARAATLYRSPRAGLDPFARAIHRLKYRGERDLVRPLGALFAARYPFAPDALLVPVPLHLSRLRVRGYNQSLLLARDLARRLGMSVAARALTRVHPTIAQTSLDAARRRENLHDAFRVRRPGTIARRHVVVIDDVLTTGSTAAACTIALVRAGACRVSVYTLARAPRSHGAHHLEATPIRR